MKKFQFKILIASLSAFFVLSGCSRLIDAVWNSDAAEFKITATSAPGVPFEIRIQIPKSDHQNSLRETTDQKKGKYFWGYYIYRNDSSPYDDFYLRGIEKQVILTNDADPKLRVWDSFSEKPSGTTDLTDYYSDACTFGKTYYYRAAVVYREFDGNEWTTNLEDKSASSWVAALCQ